MTCSYLSSPTILPARESRFQFSLLRGSPKVCQSICQLQQWRGAAEREVPRSRGGGSCSLNGRMLDCFMLNSDQALLTTPSFTEFLQRLASTSLTHRHSFLPFKLTASLCYKVLVCERGDCVTMMSWPSSQHGGRGHTEHLIPTPACTDCTLSDPVHI